MNAQEYLKEFLELAHAKKNILENIRDIKFNTTIKGNSITLALIIVAEIAEKEEEIPAKIAVPISRPIMR